MTEQTYAPKWAPHVVGRYPEREPDGDGGWEPQLVRIECGKCGEAFRITCNSGAVKQHVLRFATLHIHRDPFKTDPRGSAKEKKMTQQAKYDPTDPRSEPLMRFFKWEHLPEHLQGISKPFGVLAMHIFNTLPRNAERTVSLRKLLEAKDCAVRAGLPEEAVSSAPVTEKQ